MENKIQLKFRVFSSFFFFGTHHTIEITQNILMKMDMFNGAIQKLSFE